MGYCQFAIHTVDVAATSMLCCTFTKIISSICAEEAVTSSSLCDTRPHEALAKQPCWHLLHTWLPLQICEPTPRQLCDASSQDDCHHSKIPDRTAAHHCMLGQYLYLIGHGFSTEFIELLPGDVKRKVSCAQYLTLLHLGAAKHAFQHQFIGCFSTHHHHL